MKIYLREFDQKYFFSILLAFAFALPFNTLTAINSILMALLFLLWLFKIYDSKGAILFRTPLDIPLLGFFAWAGLSILWTVDLHESLNSWIALGKQVFLFYLVATTVKTRDQFVKILAVFLAAIVITDIYSIIDFFYRGGDILNRGLRAGTFGSADSHSLISLLVIFIPLAFIMNVYLVSKKYIKILLSVFLFISIITLYLSFTRAGWLTVCIELIIFGWFYQRRFFYYTSGIILIIFIITVFAIKHIDAPSLENIKKVDRNMTDSESTESRIKLWKFSFTEILKYPFTGYGYGKGIFNKINKGNEILKEGPHIHNTFLETAFEVGLPGLILFTVCFWTVFERSLFLYKQSQESFIKLYSFFMIIMVSGVVFRNLFDHMFVGNLAEIFWVLSGLLFTFRLNRFPESIYHSHLS